MEAYINDSYLNKHIFVYLNDILILSKLKDEHVHHVQAVLQRLLENCSSRWRNVTSTPPLFPSWGTLLVNHPDGPLQGLTSSHRGSWGFPTYTGGSSMGTALLHLLSQCRHPPRCTSNGPLPMMRHFPVPQNPFHICPHLYAWPCEIVCGRGGCLTSGSGCCSLSTYTWGSEATPFWLLLQAFVTSGEELGHPKLGVVWRQTGLRGVAPLAWRC